MDEKTKEKGFSVLLGIGAAAIIGSGIAGYVKGQSMKHGVPITSQSLDTMLMYGPAAIGAAGGIANGFNFGGKRLEGLYIGGLISTTGACAAVNVIAQGIGIGAAYLFGN